MMSNSWIEDGYEYDADGVIRKKECDCPGCKALGEYPAPKGKESENRTRPEQWYWFCLEHVRIFNTAWDFGKQMSPAELEEWRRKDETWHRPSWPFGADKPKDWENLNYEDPFNLFSGKAKQRSQPNNLSKPIDQELNQALSILGIDFPYSADELKQKYRILAKKYHPDLNANNPKAEERLKEINEAYMLLKKNIRDYNSSV